MTNPLIIERPDLQAWQQKALFGALTAIFWAVWVFLWLPLVTLLGWLFFGYRFQFHMIELDGYAGFVELLAIYGLVILAMGGGLIVWAKYNHWRFRGTDRRKGYGVPTTAQLAAYYAVPTDTLAQWQNVSVMTVHHDAHGAITRVVPNATVAPMATASRPRAQTLVDPEARSR